MCWQKHTVTPTFSIVPQSATHVRLVYRNKYCLDLQCRHGRLVSVRDGVYSTFETNKVIECLNPIPNLQVCQTVECLSPIPNLQVCHAAAADICRPCHLITVMMHLLHWQLRHTVLRRLDSDASSNCCCCSISVELVHMSNNDTSLQSSCCQITEHRIVLCSPAVLVLSSADGV